MLMSLDVFEADWRSDVFHNHKTLRCIHWQTNIRGSYIVPRDVVAFAVQYGARRVRSQSVVMQLVCCCHDEIHNVVMYKIPKEEAG